MQNHSRINHFILPHCGHYNVMLSVWSRATYEVVVIRINQTLQPPALHEALLGGSAVIGMIWFLSAQGGVSLTALSHHYLLTVIGSFG